MVIINLGSKIRRGGNKRGWGVCEELRFKKRTPLTLDPNIYTHISRHFSTFPATPDISGRSGNVGVQCGGHN